MPDGFAALTEKEKQTLRLVVRGHDAKSLARALGLSVHTVNDRLREARRKLAVSSSREAARLLFEHEGATPESSAHTVSGDAPAPGAADGVAAPDGNARHRRRRLSRAATAGVLAMTLALAAILVAAVPQLASRAPGDAPATADATNAEVEQTARRWLVLLDQGRWADSYRETGAAFRRLNTLAVWTAASQRVRAPLGVPSARTLLSQDEVPAPPEGYRMVKFRTAFATNPDAVETVTLAREDGAWRVVGVTVG